MIVCHLKLSVVLGFRYKSNLCAYACLVYLTFNDLNTTCREFCAYWMYLIHRFSEFSVGQFRYARLIKYLLKSSAMHEILRPFVNNGRYSWKEKCL